jgi:hypothetical protein
MTVAPFLALLSVLLPLQDSPLLSYQAMDKLKQRLARVTVEVEVTLAVPDGADPTIAPVLLGQGTCVPDVAGSPHLVTSAFLVQGASKLRIRSRQTPEWSTARVTRIDFEVGLAEVAPTPEQAFRCRKVAPAPAALEAAGGLVFSIDNPTEWTAIFFGNLAGRPTAPLEAYLLSASGLPLGGPLYSPEAKLAAINLRHYVPGGQHHLASPATMIWQWVWGKQREAAKANRRPRRGISNR